MKKLFGLTLVLLVGSLCLVQCSEKETVHVIKEEAPAPEKQEDDKDFSLEIGSDGVSVKSDKVKVDVKGD